MRREPNPTPRVLPQADLSGPAWYKHSTGKGLPIDLSAIKRDLEASMEATAKGEDWCWRCARLAEYGKGGLCEHCAEHDRSLLPQLAQMRLWLLMGKNTYKIDRPEERFGTPEAQRIAARKAMKKRRKLDALAVVADGRRGTRVSARAELADEQHALARRLLAEFRAQQNPPKDAAK